MAALVRAIVGACEWLGADKELAHELAETALLIARGRQSTWPGFLIDFKSATRCLIAKRKSSSTRAVLVFVFGFVVMRSSCGL
jgi:hypothetical protein